MAGPIVLTSPTMSNSCQDSGLSPNVQGIFWMLTAGLFFSLMVALVKVLGSRFPSVEIVLFRSLVQLVVLFFVFWRTGFDSLKPNRPWLQGVRSLLAVALINCNYYAFTQLPLADVTAIGFSRNLFLAVLAVMVLGERLNTPRLLALLAGFLGILIVVRPGSGIFEASAGVALLGACLGAVMMTLIRKLTATDSNIVMMLYPAIAITCATSIPASMVWVTPTSGEMGLLILMSLAGVIGQWCLIQGFRRGEATVVSPANYVRLVFATFFGFYLFGEIPDRYTILGSLIIIASNLLLIFHEGRPTKTGPGERVPGDVT